MKKHSFTLKSVTPHTDFYLRNPEPPPDKLIWLCRHDVEEYFDLAGKKIMVEITLENPGNPEAYKARLGQHEASEDPSLDLLLKNHRWVSTSTTEQVCKYLARTLKLTIKHQPFWIVLYHW